MFGKRKKKGKTSVAYFINAFVTSIKTIDKLFWHHCFCWSFIFVLFFSFQSNRIGQNVQKNKVYWSKEFSCWYVMFYKFPQVRMLKGALTMMQVYMIKCYGRYISLVYLIWFCTSLVQNTNINIICTRLKLSVWCIESRWVKRR